MRGSKDRAVWFTSLSPFLLLILLVWLIRLGIDLLDAPLWLSRLFSVSAVVPAAIVLASALLFIRNVATYSRVMLSSLVLMSWGQLLVVTALLFSMMTGWENVFTRPEFSLPGDPRQIAHLVSHLMAIPVGTVLGGAMGCFILWLMRRMVPR